MRMKAILAAALFLSLSGPAFAQEWVEFVSREDRVTATFPVQPTVTQTTYKSQFGADLPARVYSAVQGQSRFSLTVADYSQIERILTEKAKACPPGAETCRGGGSSTGAGYYRADVAGAIIHATWQFLQRDATLTYMGWNNVDLVGGHMLSLTNNADKSRTSAAIYMHDRKLYILEGTVPAGAPEPGFFQQSIAWLDENGNGIRYETLYHQSFPAPPIANRGGQGPAAAPARQEALSESYRGSQRNNVEYQQVAPFKVFDNLYYVGPGFVSVWLLQTSDGLILIDAAQDPYEDHILNGIRKLGFDPKNVKYILISHGHLDHFGGAAKLQAASGARVGMLAEDWDAMEQAARPTANRPAAVPIPKRDLVLEEGDTLTLGHTTLKFYKHPGHTAGSLSAEFTVFDNGRPHKAFMFGGPGPRGGVAGAGQFLESANRVAKIQGVEVAVPVHSWLNDFHYPSGGIFERAQKLAQRRPGDPHPFVDPASWNLWITQVQAGAAKNLEEEKLKAAGSAAR